MNTLTVYAVYIPDESTLKEEAEGKKAKEPTDFAGGFNVYGADFNENGKVCSHSLPGVPLFGNTQFFESDAFPFVEDYADNNGYQYINPYQ